MKERIGNYKIIMQQMGGRMFENMTGCRFLGFGYTDNGYVYLVIKLIKNPSTATFLRIELNYLDLYDMIFFKVNKGNPITVKEYKNIYAEDLQPIFTKVTGLDTHL